MYKIIIPNGQITFSGASFHKHLKLIAPHVTHDLGMPVSRVATIIKKKGSIIMEKGHVRAYVWSNHALMW